MRQQGRSVRKRGIKGDKSRWSSSGSGTTRRSLLQELLFLHRLLQRARIDVEEMLLQDMTPDVRTSGMNDRTIVSHGRDTVISSIITMSHLKKSCLS